MRIVDLLKKEAVVLNADVSEKEQMLDLLVDLHKKVGNIEDKEAFKAGIMKRESEGPTAIAEGICIPHSKNDAVITVTMKTSEVSVRFRYIGSKCQL